ncbi:MAG: alanine racemase [Elusimicrobia bacterium GWA2_69_24]|nr:MAG: alanine racemase [Elusimicrobia bacterium GWA2_69_24]HBL17592.1 alanine racemase [Elusimicrobiota bacterium]
MAPPFHLKWVDIDLRAIASNLRWIRRRLSPGVQLMVVVKADAYGHGAERVSRLALAEGADCLGVLNLEEAVRLRQGGIRSRIVVLCPPLPQQAAGVAAARVEPAVDSWELARALDRAAAAARRVIPVHLDLDFGLGRWGMPPKEVPGFLRRLRRLRRLRPAGIAAHLDYVPGQNAVEAEEKLRRFDLCAAEARGLLPGLTRHCANTSILMDFPHWQMDMVRIGNLVYGINPTSKPAPLKNPWKLFARIVSLREVGKGRAIGYGSEYLAPRRMRVASLAIGYSDGLTMEPAQRLIGLGLGFHYYGWLRGRRVPFVGRSGIAHILVDVSGVPRARVGDPVSLPVRRTAADARLPRVYRG